MGRLFTLFVPLVGVACCGVAAAAPVNSIAFSDGNVLNSALTVGTGANTAYTVVDFTDGTKVAYQYKFDGSSTVTQELTALDAADPNLTIDLQSFGGLGSYINNVTYGTSTGSTGTYYFALYNGSYSAADVSGANPQGTTFTYSSTGIDTTPITNGTFSGLINLDYTATTPDQPIVLPQIAPSVTSVPEPASVTLAVVGTTGLLTRRRRRLA